MNEIFVDVLGYEGLYKVSNYGNVFSIKSNKLLKSAKNYIWRFKEEVA